MSPTDEGALGFVDISGFLFFSSSGTQTGGCLAILHQTAETCRGWGHAQDLVIGLVRVQYQRIS